MGARYARRTAPGSLESRATARATAKVPRLSAILAAYRRVLRNRPLSALLAGEFVSSVGDWLYLVALLIIVYQRSGDPVLLGVVGAARVLPYVVLSIPAGIVADRFDRRLVLLITDLARGGLMLVLAWLVATGGSTEAIVGVTILATCLSAFFGPALGAYLPSLVVDERDLGPANTAYSTLDNVAFVIGPALASLIVAAGSLELAFLINAGTFAVVAVVLARLPSTAPAAATDAAGEGDDASPAVAPGLRAVLRPVGAIMGIDTVESFVFGGLGVLTVVIAFDRLGMGDEGTGLLNAAVGVGGLVGAIASGALVLRRSLAPPMLLGAGLMALGVAIVGLAAGLGPIALGFGLGAVGELLLSVASATLIQRLVPGGRLGRVLGVRETVNVLAYALGALLMPMIVGVVGIEPVLVASAVAIAVAAAIAIPLMGEHALQALPADPARDVLARVPELAGLASASLERAQARSRVVPMEAGHVVIRQGAVADRYFVIVDGQVDVTATATPGADPRHLRTMGPGEGFGEIGLLAGIPRTATVTARTRGTLLELDRADFLELVAGGTGLTFPLLDAHRAPVVEATT
jgi:MFS family permease